MAESDEYSSNTTSVLFSLKELGINERFMTSSNVTMESEKYICIKVTSPDDSVVVIDMDRPMQPLRLPIAADLALMNPHNPVLAYKVEVEIDGTTQDQLQIYNVETKKMMKSYNTSEKVEYLKWIKPELLGLVTEEAVYHWSTAGLSSSVKMFNRTETSEMRTIANYLCDPSEKWLALIGTRRRLFGKYLTEGVMQLFSVEQQNSQEFKAYAASFTTFNVEENDTTSTLIYFVTSDSLHVIELGVEPGKPGFGRRKADFRTTSYFDCPLELQISLKYGLLYVLTKKGLIFLHDLETAEAICHSDKGCDRNIIVAVTGTSTGSFYAIDSSGQVLVTTVNDSTILSLLIGEELTLHKDETPPWKKYLRELLLYRGNLHDHRKLRQEMLCEIERLKRQNLELNNETRIRRETENELIGTRIELNNCRISQQEMLNKIEELKELNAKLQNDCRISQQEMLNEIEELKELNAKLQNDCRISQQEMLTKIEELKEKDKVLTELKEELTGRTTEIDHYAKSQEEMRNEIEEFKSQNIRLTKEMDDVMRNLLEFRLLIEGNNLEDNFTEFTHDVLREVTNDFNVSLKIGEGGYGPVFKAFLGLKPVAIKILKRDRRHGMREFNQEVEILGRVRHPNVVMLLGACQEAYALVYELMPNGSLYDILRSKQNALTWKTRIRIASNICSALMFLHSFPPNGIVHGDLKSANILLDSNYTGKLSDFGISRPLRKTDSRATAYHHTVILKGSRTYMDDEYILTGELTAQYDVYSFGIVLLELVTGRDPKRLRAEVTVALEKEQELVNSSSGGWPQEFANRMVVLGIQCSYPYRENRPDLEKEVWPEIESMQRASLRF